MTKEEFDEWTNDVHCSLFHVEKTDLDDIHKVRIDQLCVLNHITRHPKVLQHKTLKELLETFDVLD